MESQFVTEVVYHSSLTSGLTHITPHISAHGQAWVYATEDIVMSSVFLTRTNDFDFVCASGDYEGMPILIERFAGAFNHAYEGMKGSIYVLPRTTFIADQTPWSTELISTEEVMPLQEIVVPDAKALLLQYMAEQRLVIKWYPERVPDIPDDDEDLVQKAVELNAMDEIARYHPHLLPRVEAVIALRQTRASKEG
jgi:hypothetical protein